MNVVKIKNKNNAIQYNNIDITLSHNMHVTVNMHELADNADPKDSIAQ